MCRLNDRFSTRAQVDYKNRIENHFFNKYIFYIQITPCHVARLRLEKMYSEVAGSLREILSLAEKVSIASEASAALTTESYLTVAVHFFTD